MDSPPCPHPTDQTLLSYGLGKLDDTAAETVNSHLEQCVDCRRRIAEISGDSFLLRLRGAHVGPGLPTIGQSPEARGPASPAPAQPQISAETLPPELAEHPQYEVVKELGRGGMGVVYLARNKLMDRLEVLKVLNKEMLDRRGTLDRFLREIRSAAQLNHSNVVAAYSALQIGHLIVFAMEYVDGLDLAKMVKHKGPLPVGHASYFIHQAALGLQHAHEKGMVHRDIKPGNLILSREGNRAIVKVLDFGLAKATREDPLDSGLTHEGQMLGTPDYIAPEQTLNAQKSDIRADIYSLGCTLYYLLAGGPPFRGASLYDILQAHHSVDAKPLNLVRTDVPVELAALVAKMMAKEPQRRFQTPAEVAKALTPIFKAGRAAAVGSNEELSHAGQPDSSLSTAGISLAPTQPATDVARHPVSAPTQQGVRWESVINFKNTEQSNDASKSKLATAAWRMRRPPWMTWPVIAAASLSRGVVALGVIIHVTTEKGRTTITAPDGKTVKAVIDGDVVVEYDPTKGSPSGSGAGGLSTKTVKSPVPAAGSRSGDGARAGEERDDNAPKMKFCWCPPGSFRMGSSSDEPDRRAVEGPVNVTLGRGFWMGKYEVTQDQWLQIMGTTVRDQRAKSDRNDLSGEGSNHPIYYVSHTEVEEFCRKLTESERGSGRLPAGWSYRLPTEAQWEYACRAGTTTATAFGDRLSSVDANFIGDYPYNGATKGPNLKSTTSVGKYRSNGWGLYDMHGNVWEWCLDGYAEQLAGGDDPVGPLSASLRVIRGGSWDYDGRRCRSAFRNGNAPGTRNYDLGFRVARVPSGF